MSAKIYIYKYIYEIKTFQIKKRSFFSICRLCFQLTFISELVQVQYGGGGARPKYWVGPPNPTRNQHVLRKQTILSVCFALFFFRRDQGSRNKNSFLSVQPLRLLAPHPHPPPLASAQWSQELFFVLKQSETDFGNFIFSMIFGLKEPHLQVNIPRNLLNTASLPIDNTIH